jgi:hypothetical protein
MTSLRHCLPLGGHGAPINAAAKVSLINYRTAQPMVEAAAERDQQGLVAVG